MSPLGRISQQSFLADYWQKQPLFIKGGYRRVVGLLSPDELAGLACEEHIASRLVREKGGKKPWQVTKGPFSEQTLRKLPDGGWSLLVHGLERRLPEIAALLDDFRFIPLWRLDDIMVSYAPDGGSVGPHTDEYDVFLVQARGKRRWEISAQPVPDEFQPDLDLKILKQFKPAQTFLAEEGDVLYLPPGYAHHGVAVGEAMTFSIGFRAPSASELWNSMADVLAADPDVQGRYQDPDLALPQVIGEIDDAAIARAAALIKTVLLSKVNIGEALGRWGTQSGDELAFEPRPRFTQAQLDKALAAGKVLRRVDGLRLSFGSFEPTQVTFFVEGQSFRLPRTQEGLARLLCAAPVITKRDLEPFLSHPEAAAVVLAGIRSGFWVVAKG